MSKRKKKNRHGQGVRGIAAKRGMAPGTPVFVGERKVDAPRIDLVAYSQTALDELCDVSVEQCLEFAGKPGVTWINVHGVHDVTLIESLGKSFGLHPLTLEDVMNTFHRPKAEDFPGYLYVVVKMVTFDDTERGVEIEHVSLVLTETCVISFQERERDVFDGVRERIQTAKGRIRSMAADYLAYALMDAVVDSYFLTVERIGDRIEDIDDRILVDPTPQDIQEVHRLKRDILGLRKAVWPLREEIGALEKMEASLIRPETKVFLRDLYDHTIQVIDMIETFRDILGGIHDTYLSSISNRTNEVMKILTIIATIFIPLTFIAGVYGMNFEYMPELKWRWGYYLICGIMIAVGIGMLRYFRRKKWL